MINCSAYFSLLKNIFIFCSMAGGKRAPEGKSHPCHTCTVIDLEMKIRILHKCEGVQSLSANACELNFAVSTVDTIVKDAVHIKNI
jgi:hypothetical protein